MGTMKLRQVVVMGDAGESGEAILTDDGIPDTGRLGGGLCSFSLLTALSLPSPQWLPVAQKGHPGEASNRQVPTNRSSTLHPTP